MYNQSTYFVEPMRINIIGPCGSGKTTLAKRIETIEREMTIIDLDSHYVAGTTWASVRHYSDGKVWEEIKIKAIGQNVILEGIFIIERILNESDLIIFLKPSLGSSLYFQWKRYITDVHQRKKFGFVNNIFLSWIILNQYFSKNEKYHFGDFDYPTIVGYEKKMKTLGDKVVRVQDERDIRKLLGELKNRVRSGKVRV